jgi:hypothetical protein
MSAGFIERVVFTYMVQRSDFNQLQALRYKVSTLMRNHALHLHVSEQPAIYACPDPRIPVYGLLDEDAQNAWDRCEMPWVLSPIELKVPTSDFDELLVVMDLLADDEHDQFFLTPAALSQSKLLHGGTRTEWKKSTGAQYDNNFLSALLIGAILLVAIFFLGRLALKARTPAMHARSPPAAFGISLLSGTAVGPMIAGMWWWKSSRASDQANGVQLRATSDDDDEVSNTAALVTNSSAE